MTDMTKGANTPVPTAPLRVAVCRRHVPGAPVVDASVLLLDANGKVRGDRDLVFYNQPVHPSGTVRHMGPVEGDGRIAEWLEIDLPRIEPAVRRLVVAGSCEGGFFGQVADLSLQSMTPDGSTVAYYSVTDAATETAFVLGEFYRRDGGWRFRAVGRGHASGLAGLVTDFGIAVEQSAPARPPAPRPQAPFTVARPETPQAGSRPVPPRREADGPWPLEVRPLPVPDRAPAQASGVCTGRGRGVVMLTNPAPGRPALLDYAVESEGSVFGHTVRIIDEYGDGEQLLRGSQDGARGRTLLFRNGESEVALGIEDAVDWRLSLHPVETAAVLTGPAQGNGSEVFRYAGPPALLGLRRLTGDEDQLATRTVQAHGRTVVSADTGGRSRPVVGPLWVSGAGHCYVLVSAGDRTGWHIEPTDLQQVPAFGRSVSGHGYGVVHHSGPETDVMLTHEPRGGLDVLAVWALDERLEPVRRVSIGGGLQRMPPGYLQIRTMGHWTFETRG
ncbi:TerD family protein [Streptomyces sp. NPDC057428]|uniref:TerD family protein n=1 Tax=Streptomyces sp. NPDC057428 TaxID=3346129 RepID=UPI00369C8045